MGIIINTKLNFNKLKQRKMKQFAFIALIGASSALKISTAGDKTTGNPYLVSDPKY